MLSAVALAWAVLRWRGLPLRRWLSQALVGLLVVRFLVPVVELGSEAVFQLFLKDDYTLGQQTLEQSSTQIGQMSGPAAARAADESVAERVRRWWAQGADIGERFEALKAVANRAVEQVMRLIVVFTLQTLVLPLLLGWVLWRLAGAVITGRPRR